MEDALEDQTPAQEYVDMRDLGDGRIAAVMSGLQFQQKLFSREMKGKLLPTEIPLVGIKDVMDFVCGPGAWCMDFSKKYPEKQVVGVDINIQIVDIARENAIPSNAGNLRFECVQDPRKLPFDSNTFDLIHLQNGASLFPLSFWPLIMAEMKRILRPGGWLNLVDFEMGPTSHPALDRGLTILSQIMAKLDMSYSPGGTMPFNGCTLGPERMNAQGFIHVGYNLYPVNLGGWNNPVGRAYLGMVVIRPEVLLCLAPKTKVSTEEELQPVIREMHRELRQIGFCGAGMLISSFGCKPPE